MIVRGRERQALTVALPERYPVRIREVQVAPPAPVVPAAPEAPVVAPDGEIVGIQELCWDATESALSVAAVARRH